MKKILLVLTVMTIFTSASFSELVSRILSYNGPGNQIDVCNAITLDQNGKVYATGVSWGGSTTKDDYATIKFSEDGDFQWVVRYNGPGNNLDYASAIAVDVQGNVYVTGWSRNGADFGTEDYYTIKYNANGQQVWAKRYNGTGDCYDFAKAIWVDASGNVYVTGISFGTNNAKDDYATIKYSPTGQEIWVARYNGPSNKEDMAYSLRLDGMGNVYVTGASLTTGKGYDMLTVKYNNNGQQQWTARYDGPSYLDDIATELRADASGNVYITGSSHGGNSKLDYVTIKYNTSGQQVWLKRFNGTANDTDVSTAIDLDVYGNAYVTGYSKSSGAAGYDYYTVKYASGNGDVLWSNTYNGNNGMDKAWDIKVLYKSCAPTGPQQPEGDIPCWLIDIYVAGQSMGGANNDFTTQRFSEQGQLYWSNRFSGPSNGNDAAFSIAAYNDKPIIYAGGSFSSDYGIIGIAEERISDGFVNNGQMSSSYPNPFNPETKISFKVDKESNVKITVYDMLGREVALLTDKKYSGGLYAVNFNAAELNSGVYFYRIDTEYASETKKLVLVK